MYDCHPYIVGIFVIAALIQSTSVGMAVIYLSVFRLLFVFVTEYSSVKISLLSIIYCILGTSTTYSDHT